MMPEMPERRNEQPEFYAVKFVAMKLGLHADTILKLIKEGKIEAIQIGRIFRIPRSELPKIRERFRVKT